MGLGVSAVTGHLRLPRWIVGWGNLRGPKGDLLFSITCWVLMAKRGFATREARLGWIQRCRSEFLLFSTTNWVRLEKSLFLKTEVDGSCGLELVGCGQVRTLAIGDSWRGCRFRKSDGCRSSTCILNPKSSVPVPPGDRGDCFHLVKGENNDATGVNENRRLRAKPSQNPERRE
jgi:hypothetical protein